MEGIVTIQGMSGNREQVIATCNSRTSLVKTSCPTRQQTTSVLLSPVLSAVSLQMFPDAELWENSSSVAFL